MKKKFLAGLTTIFFMAALVGLPQAATNISNFEGAEVIAAKKMLKEKALKPMPAASCEKIVKITAVVEEDDPCDWNEFEEYDEGKKE
jgi:hypothetical protein